VTAGVSRGRVASGPAALTAAEVEAVDLARELLRIDAPGVAVIVLSAAARQYPTTEPGRADQ
jgi:hypothetical protein